MTLNSAKNGDLPTGQLTRLIRVVFVLVLASSLVPCARARIFSSPPMQLELDLKFLLTLTAYQDGFLVDSAQLTENNVNEVNVNRTDLGWLDTVQLVFNGANGREKGHLTYSVFSYSVDAYDNLIDIEMARDVAFSPRDMFLHVKSDLENVQLGESRRDPSSAAGDYKNKEVISFSKTPITLDSYVYGAELEVSSREFDAKKMKENRQHSPSGHPELIMMAVFVGAGILLVAIVTVSVGLYIRHSRRTRPVDKVGFVQKA